MIYTALLVVHSLFRWFLLISLFYSIYQAFKGWSSKLPYTPRFDKIRNITVILAHVQLIVGLGLYFISPVIRQLFNNFGEAVQESAIRFYGMEHSLIMIIAIVLITIGSAKAKRLSEDVKKFKSIAIWFTIGLILILITIPWPFSPFDARPLFRIF
ncbi:cytochrome B [Rhodohalobacter sulfatireducens]|uniref:Cytochrome B n=1 Tax=Rhodohalobacter sulfatireducens TaxID=2911366 RepID=A0ABS9KJ92_9BACT|nr:cytochrome B [Rhodohalobacter sulfatireducens]MCG2590903.1 cytochrome B [Rhodohalobacter sulfatireducens]MDR9367384.1 cytochrome B [Balneolaceae bacterium]MDR9409266.1 cytochrome B [Balneolaceae bacterium]